MSNPSPSSTPWWRYGHVWLLIAGPAAVVVAGFVTLVIAVRGADPLVASDYYRRGLALSRQAPGQRALLPAQEGRNHAATPAEEP